MFCFAGNWQLDFVEALPNPLPLAEKVLEQEACHFGIRFSKKPLRY